MNIRIICICAAALMAAGPLRGAVPLTESTFTEVINEVNVLAPQTRAAKPARIEEVFKAPEILRTGSDSRAELTAPDKTITRVGANTVFSFEPKGRNINLNQGTILFHSPTGKGGGTIRTGGASASVLGTTIIVVATAGGGFKTVVLEGKGQVRLPNGDFRVLQAGQLVFVLPGARQFGPLLNINLEKLVGGSGLVKDFPTKLSSMDRVQAAVAVQNRMIARGKAVDTGLWVGRSATRDSVHVVDPSVLEISLAEGSSPGKKSVRVRAAKGKIPKSGLRKSVKISRPLLDRKRIYDGEPGIDRTFAGGNITINTPVIDMSPDTGSPSEAFTFYAAGKMKIEKSVSFDGQAGSDFDLFLLSERGVEIKSGSTLQAHEVGNLHIRSEASASFTDVTFENVLGMELSARDNLSLKGMSSAGTSVSAGDLALSADRGNLTLRDVSLFSPAVTMRAGETLTLEKTSLTGLTSISMDARTLNLKDVNFPGGSTVNLRSQLGVLAPDPNTGRSPVPGHVNFINHVTYGGTPAQFAVGNGITISARP